MKTAIGVGGAASGQRRDFERLAAFAVEAEKLGVDRALAPWRGATTRPRSSPIGRVVEIARDEGRRT